MLDEVEMDVHTVLTVGFFDGVHRGHRTVLDSVLAEAERNGARALMVTFDRPPRSVLHGVSVPLLTTLREKASIVRDLGLTDTVVIPFDQAFAQLDGAEFVRSILVERIGLTRIVLGYDHRFGRGGTGTVDTMRTLGRAHGFDVQIVPAQKQDGEAYSSTRIRELLANEGDVAEAAALLGRNYRIRGGVVHGDGRGRTIGFPTANLELLESEKVVPATGVYAVFTRLRGDRSWRSGIMNLGYRPTVTDAVDLVAEVHLLDFQGDLYGSEAEVAFVRRIRNEKRFDGVESLVRQIRRDLEDCKEILASVSLPD